MNDVIKSFFGEYRFLSNFHPAVVNLDCIVYPTVEHAYQAAKTLDVAQRNAIRDAKTPGQAKKLGNTVDLRDGWDNMKLEVMKSLIEQKFSWIMNPKLAQMLVDTGDAILIEGNYWGDTYWGMCGGKGLNNLGHLLMDRREVLKATKKDTAPWPFDIPALKDVVSKQLGDQVVDGLVQIITNPKTKGLSYCIPFSITGHRMFRITVSQDQEIK